MKLLAKWLLSAAALLSVAYLYSGVQITGFSAALIAALARSNALAIRVRLAVGETGARANVIDSQGLAEIYRSQSFTGSELANALSAKVDPAARRALLFQAAEGERTPLKRTRLVRTALDDARRVGLYLPMAAALARAVEDVEPVAEIGWFAETAVEVMLAAGRFDRARRWAEVAGQPGMAADRAAGALSHWLALIDIADPAQRARRGESLASVEDVALRGRFTSEGLHRLASVLDALDYHVPMRLWETASRSPQPTSGHLPATGVLSDLQAAARQKDLAGTVIGSLARSVALVLLVTLVATALIYGTWPAGAAETGALVEADFAAADK